MGRKKKQTLKENVLTQALADVKEREARYGDPLINHTRVVTLWSAWEACKAPGAPVQPLDSIVFQILTNLARIAETPNHKGAWDNIAGYAGVGYEVVS